MKIDKAKVEHIAKLARLDLSENEKEKFSIQLSQIIEYVEKLNHLKLEKVKPLYHPLENISNVFREDEIKKFKEIKKLLDIAPDVDGGYFKVPKVIDK